MNEKSRNNVYFKRKRDFKAAIYPSDFNKLLNKHDIEYEQLTAGEYKRTLAMFGENTDKARDKFKEELEETHGLFKNFINERRPTLDLDKVATGEHWSGTQAKDLGLIDEIST
jgi:serine protease SohB